MRTKTVTRCMILCLALFVVGLTAVTSAEADVCSASGSILIAQPSPPINPIQVGDTVSYNVFIANNCIDVNTATAVPAQLTGTTIVKLACLDGNCLTELPGTMTFQSCTNLNAGVASCAVDSGNSNHVIITINSIPIPASGVTQIGTIVTTATAPVLADGTNGTFITRADTGPSDLLTASTACTPNVPGGAQGSTSSNFPPVPHITVEKSCTSPTSCGDTSVPFTISITNDGQEAVSITAINDTLSGLSCSNMPSLPTTLSNISGSNVITINCSVTGSAGASFTNTVTVDSTGLVSGAAANGSATSNTCTIPTCPPHITVAKSCTSPTSCGATSVDFTITITNDGQQPVSISAINDTLAGLTCSNMPTLPTTLSNVSGSNILTINCSVPGTFGDSFTNTVNVSSTGTLTGETANGSATSNTCTIPTCPPHITVAKSCTSPTSCSATSVDFTITITNDGQQPVSISAINDTLAGLTCSNMPTLPTTLSNVSGSNVLTVNCSVPGTSGDSFTNTVNVSSTGTLTGQAANGSATSNTCTIPTCPPHITVAKSCTSPTSCGATSVPFTITITNDGGQPVSISAINDTLAGLTCSNMPTLPTTLSNVSGSNILTIDCSVSGTAGESFTNTVNVSSTGTVTGETANGSATSNTCEIPPAPSVTATKACASTNLACDATSAEFTIHICNTGSVDESVTVTDSDCGLTDSPVGTISAGACTGQAGQPADVTCTSSNVSNGTITNSGGSVNATANGCSTGPVAFQSATCTLPPCVTAICRTPGFWGTHAGTEKDNPNNPSQNITQDVINACGGCLDVCGGIIDNTLLNDMNSAVEAICVSPSGSIKLQLARQLTAMALNCCMSDAGSTCTGDPSLLNLYNSCNITCTNSMDTSAITSCIERIDCFNNGGNFTTLDTDGFCATGTCSDNGAPCTSDNLSQCATPGTATCQPNENNCHNQPLCSAALGLCFDANAAGVDCSASDSTYTICTAAPGPAGSSTECSQAIKGTGTGKSNVPNFCAVIPKPSSRDCSDKNQGEECCATGTPDGSCTSCAHDLCTTGTALSASCDPCVALICADNPSCCDTTSGTWDSTCVGDVSSICGEQICQ